MILLDAMRSNSVPSRLFETLYHNIGTAVVLEAMASVMQTDSELSATRFELESNARYYRNCAATVVRNISDIVNDQT